MRSSQERLPPYHHVERRLLYKRLDYRTLLAANCLVCILVCVVTMCSPNIIARMLFERFCLGLLWCCTRNLGWICSARAVSPNPVLAVCTGMHGKVRLEMVKEQGAPDTICSPI